MFKPRLLRETAEIALTEIKRFIEPKIAEEFSLRRVSAPLYLSRESGLNDPGETVSFRLPHSGGEMEIVRGLDRWLRSQLVRYDIAPGFGVFTVMNALRPEAEDSAISSPHVGAWAWQQVIAPSHADEERLEAVSKRLYAMLRECEGMILSRFPHLSATLPERLKPIGIQELRDKYPGMDDRRAEYLYLRDNPDRAVQVIRDSSVNDDGAVSGGSGDGVGVMNSGVEDDCLVTSTILVWNTVVGLPLAIASTGINLHIPVGSIGGTIYRDQLAMQILHQPHLLR